MKPNNRLQSSIHRAQARAITVHSLLLCAFLLILYFLNAQMSGIPAVAGPAGPGATPMSSNSACRDKTNLPAKNSKQTQCGHAQRAQTFLDVSKWLVS